jgi:hypothetical protein
MPLRARDRSNWLCACRLTGSGSRSRVAIWFRRCCRAEPVPCPLSWLVLGAAAEDHDVDDDDYDLRWACKVTDWASNGCQVSDSKVEEMLVDLIPFAIDHALKKPKVPGAPAWKPPNVRAMHSTVQQAGGYTPPQRHCQSICRKCNYAQGAQEFCMRCPMVRVKGSGNVHVADWIEEAVLIWDLDVLIQEWLLDDDIAPALLNYLRDLSSGKALDEQQVVYHERMNEASGADGRHFLWTYHTDGFAPLATSPNTFSMTYGILKAMLGSAMSHLRSACKIWFLTNGPGHNKSTSWFDHILEAQIREVVFRGVMCRWRHRMVLPAAGTIYCKCLGTEASCTCTVVYEPGEFQCHGIIALAAADQPATQVSTGRINHNAAQACRYPHVHALHKHMDMAALSLVCHNWFRLVSTS